MGRNTVSVIGNEAATTTKASTLSLQSRGTCSSFQGERVFNFYLTKEAYFVIQGSLDSNSALTCPTTNCESLWIESLSAPIASASSSPAIVASYSDWLLVALKPNPTACSILSPVGEVNCRPMSAPDCLEAPSTQRVHTPFYPGKYMAVGFLRGSQLRLAPYLKVLACTGCHTHLIPLPNEPSFQTDPVYESCPGVEDQLAPQRDEPESMGGASRRLSRGQR